MTAESRFIKIGAAGEDLPANANKWEAVRDNRTGLIWSTTQKEVKHWREAAGVAKLITDAGCNDWRLPTVEELFLLADRTRVNPAIDTAVFPDCESGWYWSSDTYASSPGVYAWSVDFYNGHALWDSQDYSGFVRAVRVSQ